MADLLDLFETISFTVEDNVGHLMLNRPDAANTMNGKMAEELLSVVSHCEQYTDIRCVLISAAGKMFCAGGDLKYFESMGDNLSTAVGDLLTDIHEAIVRFTALDAPIVTAVNGVVAGGGLAFVVLADYVIAGRSASFSAAFTAAGLSPDSSSTYHLPRLIGLRRTQDFLLTNRRLTTAEALDWGLISKVVDDSELLPEATSLALKFAEGPTRAFGSAKQLLQQSWNNSLAEQVASESSGFSKTSETSDAFEGIRSFIEKRKPEFQGR